MHAYAPASSSPALTPAPINLDATDRDLLTELERNARIGWAELGRRVALSAPAVRERVQRMERAGVISAYGTHLDPERVGRPIGAFVRVAVPTQGRLGNLLEFAGERREIVECHSVTGDDSVLLRVQVASMVEMDRIATSLARFGRTTTSMILGSPVPRRNVAVR